MTSAAFSGTGSGGSGAAMGGMALTVLIGLAVGLVVLVPSFWYLFRVFKRDPGALHH